MQLTRFSHPFIVTAMIWLLSCTALHAAPPDTLPKPYAPAISVVRFDGYIHTNDTSKTDKPVYFDNLIAVLADKRSFDSTITTGNQQHVRLWVNGFCFNDLQPEMVNREYRAFIFRLNPDTSVTSLWRMFNNYPGYFSSVPKNLYVRLGTKEKIFYATSKTPDNQRKIELHIKPKWLPWALYLLFAGIVVMVLIFAPGIIRDTGKYALPGIIIAKKRSDKTDPNTSTIRVYDIPFSMARVQLLFWIIVVTLCMIHIWSFTGSLLLPGASVLLLLGISGGTYFVGKLIDQTANLPAGMSTQTFISDFLQEHQSEGFIPDILSDQQSINLQRLQLLIFTLFIGIQFMASVLFELRFPEMSATTLAFMGISSGMYAGMKPKENT